MRIGTNPNKENSSVKSDYLHQIIIPVFIPNQEGYFKDTYEVFKLCLESLFKTVHERTFITIVNNGSSDEVRSFINEKFENGEIHEVIHTENIGKLNAVYKGLVGNDIELVTISDADVFFLPNWQNETSKVFEKIPKAGVVGIIPQFNTFKANSENVLWDNIFSSKLKFLEVKNPTSLIRFYDSIGWERNYNMDYLKYTLGLEYKDGLKVIVGSGHVVATYKKAVFTEIQTFSKYKMGGIGLNYIDALPLLKDYWRVTTYDNFAYHMGNIPEKWMYELLENNNPTVNELRGNFSINKSVNKKWIIFRNKVLRKILANKKILYFLYLKWGLPKGNIKKF
jgi:hypothetical protein